MRLPLLCVAALALVQGAPARGRLPATGASTLLAVGGVLLLGVAGFVARRSRSGG